MDNLLLMALGNRRMRFGELHRAINGISQRMLTVTLRNLEHDGILNRTVYPRFRRASNTSSPTWALAQACARPDP